MQFKQYAQVLRPHWALIVVGVLVCVVAAAGLAWTQEPLYRAQTQLFVSATTSAGESTPSESYQGALFSQQRVTSYAEVVSSPPVAEAVINQLGLRTSVRALQSAITASVPEDTVLIDVSVTDHSARLAMAIADAVGDQFPQFVNTLEAREPSQPSPVKVSVTSPPRLPTSPASPNKPLYLAVGIFLGLTLGFALAVARELLDRRVRSDGDAVAIAGAPVLGRIPHDPQAGAQPLVVADEPTSPQAAAYRALGTNLRALGTDHDLRSFVVSSAVPAEGKSLIVGNLGLAFAQVGVAVALVDADMRRPRLAKLLGLELTKGLSDVLTGEMSLESAMHRHATLPLSLLASGRQPSNPSDLLGSPRCRQVLSELTARADIVLIDAPAVLPVTDAAILARLASAVILVARVSSTRAQEFDIAAQSLRAIGKPPLGVVLNGVPYDGWVSGYVAPRGGAVESPLDAAATKAD